MGYFGTSASPIESNPPLKNWTALALPYGEGIAALNHIRMPQLHYLDLAENPLVTLPWTELPALITLVASYSGLETLQLWQLPSIQTVSADACWALYWIDAHNCSALISLSATDCSLLADIDISGCLQLTYLQLSGCNLIDTTVDGILYQLVANGAIDGMLDLSGSDPPLLGIPNRNILITRGWTVMSA